MADTTSPTRTHHWSDRSDLEERLTHAPSAIVRRARGFWTDFKDFIGRDNILDVAVGLMIATAFTGIVNSLVSDILLPVFALLPFMNRTMSEKFAVLRAGPKAPYNTLQQALDDGAVALAWGHFVDRVANFLILGLILFGLIQIYGALSRTSQIKHTVHCAYCRKAISDKSARCAFCCSWLDGREEKETTAIPAGRPGPPSVTPGDGQ